MTGTAPTTQLTELLAELLNSHPDVEDAIFRLDSQGRRRSVLVTMHDGQEWHVVASRDLGSDA